MSISFPRTMPTRGVNKQMFEIQRVDFISPDARGRIGGITAGFPLWKAKYVLGHLTVPQADEWAAWMTTMRGQQKLFYGYKQGRALPLTYRHGLPAGFSGTLTSWAQFVDAAGTATLALTGMTAGFVLLAGDYIGFRWGTYQKALVRCVEAVTADGSGNIAAITIEPPVPTVVPGSAVAYLNNPVCLMKMIPGESSLNDSDWRGVVEGGSLGAIQDLIA